MRLTLRITVLAALTGLYACAADDPYLRTKTGAAIGGIAGAVIGHQLDDDAGRFVGGAVGAAVGGGIGYAMDRQHQQLRALAAENQRLGLEVQRLRDGSIKINVPSEVTFDVDSARIKPGFRQVLNRMASIINDDTRSSVRVVGHTDSTGSESYNLDLSERRAQSVASYLASRGVERYRMRTEGRGEYEPVASNATASGRSQNRRVEIYLIPPAT